MTLLRPRGAAVEGFEETSQVVIALGVHDPLAYADQVARVRRIDVQIRLGEVLRARRGVLEVL